MQRLIFVALTFVLIICSFCTSCANLSIVSSSSYASTKAAKSLKKISFAEPDVFTQMSNTWNDMFDGDDAWGHDFTYRFVYEYGKDFYISAGDPDFGVLYKYQPDGSRIKLAQNGFCCYQINGALYFTSYNYDSGDFAQLNVIKNGEPTVLVRHLLDSEFGQNSIYYTLETDPHTLYQLSYDGNINKFYTTDEYQISGFTVYKNQVWVYTANTDFSTKRTVLLDESGYPLTSPSVNSLCIVRNGYSYDCIGFNGHRMTRTYIATGKTETLPISVSKSVAFTELYLFYLVNDSGKNTIVYRVDASFKDPVKIMTLKDSSIDTALESIGNDLFIRNQGKIMQISENGDILRTFN